MNRLLFRTLLPATALVAFLAAAQMRTGPSPIRITPDHADWKYALGENAVFTIKVVRDGTPVSGLKVDWSIGPEAMAALRTGTVELGPEGARVEAGTRNDPGFLRLTATVQDEGRTYRGMCTIGFAPEKIQPVTRDPEGFDKFWQDGKEMLAKIAIGEQRTPYPEKTTATLNAYEVSFQTVAGSGRGASRIYGLLTEPKAPGKYPALLRVPGAGVYGVSSLVQEALENVITLSIGIHGIPVTLNDSVYSSLSRGALDTYQGFNLDSRDLYYYHRVYLGSVRAVDYLASLPNWDGKTLAVIGVSQGGALSIVTAALNPRVGALVSVHPALSDVTGYVQGRVGGWPGLFRNPVNQTKEKLETAAFYDVVNFARRLKVPGLYSWGYNDEACAPTTTYAAYNVITAPKLLTLQVETGHYIAPDQKARIMAWIGEYLKTGTAPAGLVEAPPAPLTR